MLNRKFTIFAVSTFLTFASMQVWSSDIFIEEIENTKTIEMSIIEKDTGYSAKEILEIIRECLSIIAILTAGVFGYAIIKRNLIEENVKDLITEDFSRRTALLEECIRQENKYTKRVIEANPISLAEIEALYIDSNSIYQYGIKNRTEIANVSYLLTNTIRLISRYYSNQHNKIPFTDIYVFYVTLLNVLHNIALKNIVFPSIRDLLFYTKPIKIDNDLKKIVAKPKYRVLNFIEFGSNFSQFSIEIVNFFYEVNRSRDYIIFKSAYRAFNSNDPIYRFLFLNKIYFPPVISLNQYSILSGVNIRLTMIGFINQVGVIGGKKTIDFYFMPEKELYGLPKGSNSFSLYTDFKDEYLSESIDYKISSVSISDVDTVCFRLSQDVCEDAFKKTKRKLQKKMKRVSLD